jgi:hypothetical protein
MDWVSKWKAVNNICLEQGSQSLISHLPPHFLPSLWSKLQEPVLAVLPQHFLGYPRMDEIFLAPNQHTGL